MEHEAKEPSELSVFMQNPEPLGAIDRSVIVGCLYNGGTATTSVATLSQGLGYIGAVPKSANMGLGRGNPQAIAAL